MKSSSSYLILASAVLMGSAKLYEEGGPTRRGRLANKEAKSWVFYRHYLGGEMSIKRSVTLH